MSLDKKIGIRIPRFNVNILGLKGLKDSSMISILRFCRILCKSYYKL